MEKALRDLFALLCSSPMRQPTTTLPLLRAAIDLVSREIDLNTMIIEAWILGSINKRRNVSINTYEINAILLLLTEHALRNSEWGQARDYSNALLASIHDENSMYNASYAVQYINTALILARSKYDAQTNPESCQF